MDNDGAAERMAILRSPRQRGPAGKFDLDANRMLYKTALINFNFRGAWVDPLVVHPALAQVMISWSVSSSPALGSVLTAQSLEPALDSVSPSLSAPPPLMFCLSLKNK